MNRVTTLVLVALAAAHVLPGCGSKKSAGGDTIVIWEQMDPPERARFEANLATWRAAHPDVPVEHTYFGVEDLRQKFQTAVGGGSRTPDLIFGPSDQVGPLSQIQLIQPLDQVLPAGFLDRFIPASLDTLDGHVYAAPDQVGNHLMLMYNKALVPEPPRTTAEFIALAKRLTKPASAGQPPQYGFVMNVNEPYWLAPFFAGFGGWVMDPTGAPSLDSPAMAQALAFIRDLKNIHRIMPRESDYEGAETLFKEGRAAMIINGPWAVAGYRSAGIDLGLAPIFELPNGHRAVPMVASKGYSINVHVPEAKLPRVIELLDVLTSPEAQLRDVRQLVFLPSHRDAYRDSTLVADSLLAASRSAFELGRRMPVAPTMRVLWDVMRPEMQSVMNGAKTPEQAARDMQAAAVQQLASMRQ
jgi:maltose-binding protein MalE